MNIIFENKTITWKKKQNTENEKIKNWNNKKTRVTNAINGFTLTASKNKLQHGLNYTIISFKNQAKASN